jgi:hypothetical protein
MQDYGAKTKPDWKNTGSVSRCLQERLNFGAYRLLKAKIGFVQNMDPGSFSYFVYMR